MRLELTGRQLTITPAIRRKVQQRLAHLDRILTDTAVSAQVAVARQKFRYRVEVTLHARGDHFFHGEAQDKDLDAAVASAVTKIERQAQRLKGKWQQRRRSGSVKTARRKAVKPPVQAEDTPVLRIIRARRYRVKPMSVDDAALEVGAEERSFLVFRDATNDAVTILFRRPDGHLGLIEPEA